MLPYQLLNAWTNQRPTSQIPPISLCVYMCTPLSFLGNSSEETYRGNEYTGNNRIIVGRIIFYAVCDVTKESRR
jgi:hypothetical protein